LVSGSAEPDSFLVQPGEPACGIVLTLQRQVVGELPETSAKFEHGHAGLQVELPGDQVELEALRLISSPAVLSLRSSLAWWTRAKNASSCGTSHQPSM